MLARGVWRLLQNSAGGYRIRPYVMGWFMAALHSVSVGEHSICSRAVWWLLPDSPGGYRIRPYVMGWLFRIRRGAFYMLPCGLVVVARFPGRI